MSSPASSPKRGGDAAAPLKRATVPLTLVTGGTPATRASHIALLLDGLPQQALTDASSAEPQSALPPGGGPSADATAAGDAHPSSLPEAPGMANPPFSPAASGVAWAAGAPAERAGTGPSSAPAAADGAYPSSKSAAAAGAPAPSLPVAVILEGLAVGTTPLDGKAGVAVHRVASGCLCCTGNLILRVTLNRILRVSPAHVFIALADTSHVDQLRSWLQQPPYDQLLCLTPDEALEKHLASPTSYAWKVESLIERRSNDELDL